jgi:electron transport complex protein RnfC
MNFFKSFRDLTSLIVTFILSCSSLNQLCVFSIYLFLRFPSSMKAKTFPHGIHPPEGKESTAEKALEFLPSPEKVVIPLHQHFGNPAEPLVKKGEEVFLGQKIGEAKSLFSASVHASVSGKVLSVDGHNHPLGKPVLSVTITNDGEDRVQSDGEETEDPFALGPDQIRQKVKDAGIVGLGGAAFPTAVKITPPKDKPIDTVILNGCECEPILTADYRLMMEYPDEILKGAELVRMATGADRILVGIEDNKKDLCAAREGGSERGASFRCGCRRPECGDCQSHVGRDQSRKATVREGSHRFRRRCQGT